MTDIPLTPRPTPTEPSIDTYLSTRVRVYGPHWFSRIAALFGWKRFAYPEMMSDWIESGLVPAKFWQTIEFNQKLHLCCRHMTSMTGKVYKSDPRLPHPDIFNAKCACGRNHIRFAHDTVRYDINETEEDKIANARSIFDQPYESGVNYDA